MIKTQIYDLISSKIKGMIAESKAISPDKTLHPGLRGRFREILLQNLLIPFLPVTCKAIHGTVIDTLNNRFNSQEQNTEEGKKSTEDDIVIVDAETTPNYLFNQNEGIITYESVLCRIEVKSKLDRGDLKDAIEGAQKFKKLTLSSSVGSNLLELAPLQILFAYDSDSTIDYEFKRIKEIFEETSSNINDPPIQTFCIANKGVILFVKKDGKDIGWNLIKSDGEYKEILAFIGILHCTILEQRRKRANAANDPKKIFFGLNNYLVDPNELERII